MPPLVIAHRGASGEAPENTMAAFELARAQQADMIELDVQATADGRLVVFHDGTTERWNGRRDRIADLSWAELRALRIRGEPVATFDELCQWAASVGMPLNVEIKVRGIEQPVAESLRRYGLVEQVVISSFHPAVLTTLRKVAPELRRGVLMSARAARPSAAWVMWELHRLGATAWHPEGRFGGLSRLLPLVRRHGYQVNVWTIDGPDMMRALIALGADGIITNYPARLRALLDRPSDAGT